MSFLRHSLPLGLVLLLPACGAGVFGAIFGSSQSGSDSSAPPPTQGPSVVVTPANLPFTQIQGDFQVQVTLRNYRLDESLDPTKFDSEELVEKQRREELLKADPDLVWLYKPEDGPRNLRVRIEGGSLGPGIQKYFQSFGYEDYDDETFAPQEVQFTFVEGSDTRLIVDIKPTPFLFALLEGSPGSLKDLTLPLSVVVDGKLLGGETFDFTFYAPPSISYTGPTPVPTAVDGRTTLEVQVKGLVDPDPEAAGAYVLVRDYDQPLQVIRNSELVDNPLAYRWLPATMNVVGSLVAAGDKYDGKFNVQLPANRFPGPADLAVQGGIAGADLLHRISLLYEPVLQAGGAGSGKITGGTVGDSFLLGRGLVPGKHANGAAALDFDKVELEIEKAGQTTRVPGTEFEQFSNESHIFYVLPAAPDGLPGPAKITLIQDIGMNQIRKSLTGGVRYAISTPLLGPLVHPLSGTPIRLESGRFLSEDLQAPDLALGSVVGSALLGEVQLLRRAGYGIFRTTGRSERTLLTGHQIFDLSSISRFSQGNRDSVYVAGDLSLGPRVGRVLSTGSAATPFQFESNQGFGGTNAVEDTVSGLLNADAVEDLVVLERNPTRPGVDRDVRIWLTSTTAQGQPPYLLDVPTGVGGTVVRIADLDGDGNQDVIVVSKDKAEIQYAYGLGNGTFDAKRSAVVSFLSGDLLAKDLIDVLDLLVIPDPAAPQLAKDLAVVVETTKGVGILPLRFQTSKQSPAPPVKGASLFHLEPGFHGVDSALMDVGGDKRDEVVLVIENTQGSAKILTFEYRPSQLPSFESRPWVEQTGLRFPVSAQRISLGKGVGSGVSGEGLLVLHREILDLKSEPVFSVYPRTSQGLRSPRPTIQTDVEPTALVAGHFSNTSTGTPSEILSFSPVQGTPSLTELIRHENLGVGLFEADSGSRMTVAEPVPGSVVAVPRASAGSYVVFLTRQGNLVVRTPDASPVLNTLDLGPWMGTGWNGLGADSRILVVDGDQDGTKDLVLVLMPGEPGMDVSHLIFLRGDAQHPISRVPFFAPSAAKQFEPFSGRVREAAAFSLLGTDRLGPALEVGLGIASFVWIYTLEDQLQATGNNPYAFALISPAEFEQIIGIKTSTYKMHFADLLDDGEPTGYSDMIAVTGRSLTISFNPKRNSAAGREFKVDVNMPCPLSDEEVLSIETHDMNGDGLDDILVAGIVDSGGQDVNLFVLYRNLGGGNYDNSYVYPTFLFGKAESCFALGDFNGNGVHDVQLGPRTLFSR